jgi:hypothetical protein
MAQHEYLLQFYLRTHFFKVLGRLSPVMDIIKDALPFRITGFLGFFRRSVF